MKHFDIGDQVRYNGRLARVIAMSMFSPAIRWISFDDGESKEVYVNYLEDVLDCPCGHSRTFHKN